MLLLCQAGKQFARVGHVLRRTGLKQRLCLFGQRDQGTAAIVWIGMAPDQIFSCEPVDSDAHGSGGETELQCQAPLRYARLVKSNQGCDHGEVGATYPEASEHPFKSWAEECLQSREPRCDRDRLHIEFWLCRPPTRDHPCDRVPGYVVANRRLWWDGSGPCARHAVTIALDWDKKFGLKLVSDYMMHLAEASGAPRAEEDR